MAPAVGVYDSLRTKSLEIVDSAGVPRIVITTADDGRAAILFVGRDGEQRAFLGMGSDGDTTLMLHDRDIGRRVELTLTDDGRAALLLCYRDGKPAIVASVDGENRPILIGLDPDGDLFWRGF